MKRAEFHMHTSPASPCACSSVQAMYVAARKRDIDIICFTDHGSTAGFREAIAKAENPDVLLVPGVEVSYHDPDSSFGGDVLILATNPDILEYAQDMEDNFENIFPKAPREEWFAIWAHPMAGGGMAGGAFLEAESRRMLERVDAIEAWNGGVGLASNNNPRAFQMAEENNMIMTAGSDAHHTTAVGQFIMCFEDDITTIPEMFVALRANRFTVEENDRLPLPNLSDYGIQFT